MGFFEKYPNTDFHELNLDWLLNKMRELQIQFDEFVVVNHITFSGQWDITKQYPAWTIVSDNNIGYVSIQPVPAGVLLTNADYWRAVIDYSAQIAGLQNRVTDCENDIINLQTDTSNLRSDVDTLKNYTLYYNVKDFGAIGDGINDDTQAFYDCISQAQLDLASSDLVLSTTDISIGYKIYVPAGKYRITNNLLFDGWLYVEPGQSERRGCCVHLVGDGDVQSVLDFTGAPANTDSLTFRGYFVNIENIRVNNSRNNAITIDGSTLATAHLNVNNVIISRALNYGLMLTTRCFHGTIKNVWCYSCAEGFYVGSCTSLSFISCYANSSNHGFYINDAIYTKLQSCASDGCNRAYEFTGSNVVMDSCGDEISNTPSININDDCNITVLNHFNYRGSSAFMIFRGSNSNATIIGGEIRDTLAPSTTPIVNEYSTNPQSNNRVTIENIIVPTGYNLVNNALAANITNNFTTRGINLNTSGYVDLGVLHNNRGNAYCPCKLLVTITNMATGDKNIYELLISAQSKTVTQLGANSGSAADNANFNFTVITGDILRATHVLGASASGKEFSFNITITGDARLS